MFSKKIKIILFSLAIFFLLKVSPVFAFNISNPFTAGTSLDQAILNVFNLAIGASAIIALCVLVYAGILYLTSFGKPEGILAARQYASSAILGALLLLSTYLILNTISSQFININVPNVSPPATQNIAAIKPPASNPLGSTIAIVIPIGRLIAKNLETYIADYPTPTPAPNPTPTPLPRMIRIKNVSSAILTLTQTLEQNSEKLLDDTHKCTCNGQPDSEPKPCAWLSNPGPGCKDNHCSSKDGCTSDPCFGVRQDIQDLENANMNIIYGINPGSPTDQNANGGINVEQIINEKGETDTKTKTFLLAELKKSSNEITDFTNELNRLEVAENFIENCPWRSLNSYNNFLLLKDYYSTQGWNPRETNFWNDANIIFKTSSANSSSQQYDYDKATFYCSVSGTIDNGDPYSQQIQPVEDVTGLSQQDIKDLEDALAWGALDKDYTKQTACAPEAPVGEISERVRQVGYKLIERLQMLNNLSEQMIAEIAGSVVTNPLAPAYSYPTPTPAPTHTPIANMPVNTDGLDVWVSQCSSQRCYTSAHPDCDCYCDVDDPCICGPVCLGYTGDGCVKQDPYCRCTRNCVTSPKWTEKDTCDDPNLDSACPRKEIKQNVDEIINLFEGVPRQLAKDTDETPKDREGIRDVVQGVIPLYSVVPTAQKNCDPNATPTPTPKPAPTPVCPDYTATPAPASNSGNQQNCKANYTTQLVAARREQTGITSIINQLVPQILIELEQNVRRTLSNCTPTNLQNPETALFPCSQAIGASIPNGKTIHNCCDTQTPDANGKEQLNSFGNCFKECYLEKDQLLFRQCLDICLNRTKDPSLINCIPMLNFYCCPLTGQSP